jgi:hypothetical protein
MKRVRVSLSILGSSWVSRVDYRRPVIVLLSASWVTGGSGTVVM